MQSNILQLLFFSIISAFIIRIFPPKFKKYGLFCLNIIFYLLCDARFLFLIILCTVWSYYIGKLLDQLSHKRKLCLWIGIIPVLIPLCFFKYYNFFIPIGNPALSFIMPLGISYYTFKVISYIADIYSCKRCPESSLVTYSIYVSFFPQIICGPISRSDNITKQINDLHTPSAQMLENASMLILSGLFKKLVIADRLDPYVNTIFSNPSVYPPLALWIAAFFYTIQIYCDFAGYSEIAIGVSNLLGIKCVSNFNLPYFSYSIKDFWRRWHISLSSWLKDYIYIPLGGNRKGIINKCFNILITFFVSGLWHGTGLNYICWGLFHGIFNLISVKKPLSKWKYCLQTFTTFVIIMFGWILFRVDSLQTGVQFIYHMFYHPALNIDAIIASILPFTGDYSCLSYFMTICLFIFILFIFEFREFNGKIKNLEREAQIKYIIFICSIILFGMIGQNSFLYANF